MLQTSAKIEKSPTMGYPHKHNSPNYHWTKAGRAFQIFVGLLLVVVLYYFSNIHPSSECSASSSKVLSSSRKVAFVMIQIPKIEAASSTALPDSAPSADAKSPLARAYDLNIENHRNYCTKHGYPFYIDTLNHSGRLPVWQKVVALMRIMQNAIEEDTHQWLFWSDTDTIILNDTIELESWIPPEAMSLDEETAPHVLMSRDHRGWNAGVFMIRVHPWSYAFLARVLTWPDFHPRFLSTEQTAMARLYDEYPDVRKHMVNVPMRWFNAYPTGKSVYTATNADFLVHYPGTANKEHMVLKALQNRDPEDEGKRRGKGPPMNSMEISEFWEWIATNDTQRYQAYPAQI